MAVKPGGLLEKALKLSGGRICQNCANIVKVSDKALGCTAHDKLIMPNYPPYHGNANCKDWKGDTTDDSKDA